MRVSSQDALLHEKEECIANYAAEIERLREMLVEMRKQTFGSKSERWESAEQGKFLFNEVELEASKPDAEEEAVKYIVVLPRQAWGWSALYWLGVRGGRPA